MSEYNTSHIIKLSDLDAIRQMPAMYIGTTEEPTHLLFEALDNAVDEAIAGYASVIGVFIDTKEKTVKVLDNGRGLPFNEELPLEQDSPVMISTSLHTSGKFKKSDGDSAYKISTGLHGIGLTAVVALSEWMEIEIYRDVNGTRKHAIYKFQNNTVDRKVEETTENPFSTKVTFKPNKKFFKSIDINQELIEERIRIILANYPKLKFALRVDGKLVTIQGSEEDLIKQFLSKTVSDWHTFEVKNKKGEFCKLVLGWEEDFSPVKSLSSVNLVRVHTGVHINKVFNMVRSLFMDYGKKHKFNFIQDDCLQGLKIYLNLFIINTAFAAQVKTKLESSADISVMDDLEKQLKDYFNKNKDVLMSLLERFQLYRTSQQSKKLLKNKAGNKSRINTKFTKLRDCSEPGGELIIGEGDSAVGGLIRQRNPKKHAILPLRGVIPNALTMKPAKLLENTEVKDIVQALGTGIGDKCDVSAIRYNKIILAADADPAGHWIASLLIILFASLTPDIIKKGHLYVCQTPLFGTKRNKEFVPLWTKKEIDEARANKEKINRYKGLGEFDPGDLAVFTLNVGTRKLIQVQWSNNIEKIFQLFVDAKQKRDLVLGKWTLEDSNEGVASNG